MNTGERIKQRREELGLTQTELAERMGYKSRAAICTVEKGKEDLTTTRIRKFAEALQTTPAYLMGWEEIEVQAVTDPDRLEAERLYDLYTKSTPEVQQAVELMLKSSQPKS